MNLKKERKFLGIVITEEGIYQTSFIGERFLKMNVPDRHTLNNVIVYENPSVELEYQGDHSKVYYFDTYDQAEEFSNQITSVGRWQL